MSTTDADIYSGRVPAASWWMLFVLFVLYVNSFIDRLVLTMLVSPIKADLQLSDVQVSILMGPAFAIFYALFGLPLGWAADRYPRRWVIYLGVSIWSMAAAAGGLAQSFVPLLLSRIGVGAGEASLTPAAYSLMGDNFPRRRLTIAMSIYQSGSQVGTAAAFAIGGLIIGFTTQMDTVVWPLLGVLRPWQLSLILTGAPGLILALLVFSFSEPARNARKPTGGVDANIFRYIWSERVLMLPMMLGFSLIVMLANSLLTWAPAYITREFGWTPAQYGPALGAITLVTATTMIVKGWIVDWLYAHGMKDAHLRFFTWLVLAAVPIALGTFFVSSPLMFFVLFALLQVLVAQFIIYVVGTIQMVTPKGLRAQTIALFISIFSVIGFGLGPVLTAALTDHVFRDEAKLGYSLAATSLITLPAAWLLLRLALRAVEGAIVRQDALEPIE